MLPSRLLIEIGTEELPVASLGLFYATGRENTRKALSKYRLDFKEVRIEATPRRLVFFVEELGLRQKEEKNVVLGPAHDRSYDAQGKPTPALEGFLKAQKASLSEVRIQENPRGRYVAVEKVRKGESAVKVIPELVSELLSSFPFPKMMRWEKTGFRFPRPIRWAVVLYGKSVVSFSLAGIKTGRISRGHRFLADRPFSLSGADWKEYEKRLKSHHVILPLKDREAVIRKDLQKKFHQKDFDPELVHETAQLVEEPFLIQGKYSAIYRELPKEVRTTCMKKYQKIFALPDDLDKLTNRFVAVLNGRRKGLARIQRDYENVLESRLRDAKYFYDEDTKEPLEKKVPLLKELVFLGKLGTVADRVERLRGLAGELADLLKGPDFKEEFQRVAERAALLSKVDLVTHMVGEFPELQGIMGKEYILENARNENEEERRAARRVATIVGDQYYPKNLSEDVEAVRRRMLDEPFSLLFGIADRTDLLVGAFGIHLEPTGSEDPYALRRAGGALVKLIRALSLNFAISKLIRKSYSLYQGKLDISLEELEKKLTDFLKERVIFELQAKPGSRPHEILQGVMKSSFDELADVFERYKVLCGLYQSEREVFLKTSKVVERTSNILKGVKEAVNSVDPSLFQEPLENELFNLLHKNREELQEKVRLRDYKKATQLYGQIFFKPLHDFFDHVMVNVENPQVRSNRQALMKEINFLYTEKVADLSLLSQVREGSG